MNWPKVREILRTALDEHGWSHNQLADACGVAQPTISRFLKGESQSMGLDKLEAIAGALGVTLGQLIGELPISANSRVATVLRAMEVLPDYKRDILAATATTLLESEKKEHEH
jgi:transcriptional regulator with XRE-family HTH domain